MATLAIEQMQFPFMPPPAPLPTELHNLKVNRLEPGQLGNTVRRGDKWANVPRGHDLLLTQGLDHKIVGHGRVEKVWTGRSTRFRPPCSIGTTPAARATPASCSPCATPTARTSRKMRSSSSSTTNASANYRVRPFSVWGHFEGLPCRDRILCQQHIMQRAGLCPMMTTSTFGLRSTISPFVTPSCQTGR